MLGTNHTNYRPFITTKQTLIFMNTNRISVPSFPIIPVKSSTHKKKQLTTSITYVSLTMPNTRNCDAILCSMNHILFTLVGAVTNAIYGGIIEKRISIAYMHGIQTRSYRSWK